MRVRMPLYAKLLGWLALNLVLIGLLLYFFAASNQSGFNLLLTPSVRDRLTSIARDVAEDLYNLPESEWAGVLARDGASHGVVYTADARRGPPLGGLTWGDGPPPDLGAMPPFRGPPPRTTDIRITPAGDGRGYDVFMEAFAIHRDRPPFSVRLKSHVESFRALLFFIGIGRELSFVLVVLLMTALLWWPFVWHITRSIRRISFATQQMSRGRFETRVVDDRRDELGELAAAVNAMAQRLQALRQGQQQFVADVAHEVTSPVARMQIGLGILETYVAEPGSAALGDVREDLDQMAEILNDLLLFSQSGLQSGRAPFSHVDLRAMTRKIVEAEAGDGGVIIDIPEHTTLDTNAAMLARALSNLVRNAHRYAHGGASPLEIAARMQESMLQVSVRDRGPGVPDAALARLGEPFFRPELSRSRDSGGFGLGLAIVRRCIAACNGEVIFRNRQGGGFEAQITLPVR